MHSCSFIDYYAKLTCYFNFHWLPQWLQFIRSIRRFTVRKPCYEFNFIFNVLFGKSEGRCVQKTEMYLFNKCISLIMFQDGSNSIQWENTVRRQTTSTKETSFPRQQLNNEVFGYLKRVIVTPAILFIIYSFFNIKWRERHAVFTQ